MYPVLTHDIVLMARIWEVIHLDVVLDTLSYKAEAVFPYDNRIDCTLADEKLTLEILCLVDEACLCVSFRIYLRIVHVAFSIHHLIPFPVDHRASGYGNLEYFRCG